MLPVALGAGFSSTVAVAAHVAAIWPGIAPVIGRLSGRAEWMLRLEAAARTVPEPALAEPAGSGAAFLAGRRAARDLRRDRGAERRAFGLQLEDRVRALPDASVLRRAARQDRLLDLSCLVPRAAMDRIVSLAHDAGTEAVALGLDLRVIGPCPPWSFVADG